MANNVLSLAAKVTGDTSGFRLTPAERALESLGTQVDSVVAKFKAFTADSDAAVRSQTQFTESANELVAALKEGNLTAEQFSERFASISAAATAEADALAEAARITEEFQDPLDRFLARQQELQVQFDNGRISVETYDAALEKARTDLERADAATAKLAASTEQVSSSAEKAGLNFRELTGLGAILPGQFGNISARISGIVSAGEGLSRLFSGGLQSSFANLSSSAAAMVNPFTLAAAAIVGIGVAANSVFQGLKSLEDRVERLGILADKLGVSFGFVQTLEEAGRRTGQSIEQISAAMGRLQNTLAGADEESKKATAALDRLGISVADLGRLSQQDKISLVGQRLLAIEDPAKRSAAALALFGKSGAGLVPFFKELPRAAADIERFGSAISIEDKQRLDAFGQSLDSLGTATQALGKEALLPFVTLAQGVVDVVTGFVQGVTALVRVIGNVISPIANSIGGFFTFIGKGLGAAVQGVEKILRFFGLIGPAVEVVSDQAANAAEEQIKVIAEIDKTLAKGQAALDSAINKAGQFGNAGFEAALRFQQGIEILNEQLREGEIGEEQYARGVQYVNDLFEEQIAILERAAESRRKEEEQLTREFETMSQLVADEEKRLAIARNYTNEKGEADVAAYEAAQQLIEVDRQRAFLESQINKFRAEGDILAVNAGTTRLAQLDQVATRLQNIESGEVKRREDRRKREEEIDKDIARNRERLAERQREFDLANAFELARIKSGSVEIQDIRSGGISAFFDTLKEDPAVAEYRKQRLELEKIRREIAKLNADRVAIVGGD